MDTLTLQAHAKLNLYLDIDGILDGGYHSLDMIMASVSCADIVTVRLRKDGNISVTMDGESSGEENSAYKAAKLVADSCGVGMDVTIIKRIPFCAGMGGSSADSAAVLKAAQKMLNIDAVQIFDMALKCGSDVAYMMRGGIMRAKGRGEILEKLSGLEALYDKHIVIAQLCRGASTAKVYSEFDNLGISGINRFDKALEDMRNENYSAALYNALTIPAAKLCPSIINTLYTLKEFSPAVSMTGSGSAAFAIFNDIYSAKKCYDAIKGFKYKSIVHLV